MSEVSERKAEGAAGHQFHPSVLRAYDIRGIVGETLSAQDAQALGQALGTFIGRERGTDTPRIALCYDGRLSSPELAEALCDGLMSTGAEVIEVGRGPTPLLYFSVHHLDLDGGVMVTGSHNPPTHNGFKMMLGKQALFGEQIQALGVLAAAGDVVRGEGARQQAGVTADYKAALLGGMEPGGTTLKVAWDPGNGAAGEVVEALCRELPGEHLVINGAIDGHFPAHHPDPSEEKNLTQLVELVQAEGCDLGLAFDGDGDRVGVVDRLGRVLWGDQLMILYARDVLAQHPGATVIADVKASQALFDAVEEAGGVPLMWKTGHSLIKAKMVETGALLAGEMSGHVFFKDRYFGFDDGIYAAVRLVNLLVHAEAGLEQMLDGLPQMHNTPEMRIACAEERKFAIVDEVKARVAALDADVCDVDGVRVRNEAGWWLLRASNTQAALVARCEAENAEDLAALKAMLEEQLQKSGVEL